MKQVERVVRLEILRTFIQRVEKTLSDLRSEEGQLLQGCEHTYADGRAAATGGSTKVCALCGQVLKGRDDKLWG